MEWIYNVRTSTYSGHCQYNAVVYCDDTSTEEKAGGKNGSFGDILLKQIHRSLIASMADSSRSFFSRLFAVIILLFYLYRVIRAPSTYTIIRIL